MESIWQRRVTRRQAISTGTRLGAAAAGLTLFEGHLLERMVRLGSAGGCASLKDIQHVVILMQENRSFDHYFGTMRAVSGFGDPNALPGVFQQQGYQDGSDGFLMPFHLDTTDQSKHAECLNDITHDWAPTHQCWNNGAMDQFVSTHISVDGSARGPMTMGYYRHADLAFYRELAAAFTICDHYHCSVLGPTDPNRLMSMTASIDPNGTDGGPHISTLVGNRAQRFNSYTWKTYPEVLQEAGVSWKVYSDADGHYGDNVLPYFKSYWSNAQLFANALTPSFPGTFEADCAAGTLPAVSWVLSPLVLTEHPPAPVVWGESGAATVLNALLANPDLWATTVVLMTFDEHGGFFDHVPPPTAAPGTLDEWLTAQPTSGSTGGIMGPIGLGIRVPMIVASPFSTGGLRDASVADHTSTLRLIESWQAAKGVQVPVCNLSAWRRSHTGDLTSALNLSAGVNSSVPSLPQPSLADPAVVTECGAQAAYSEASGGDQSNPLLSLPPYPVPPNAMPQADEGPASMPTPSGLVACT